MKLLPLILSSQTHLQYSGFKQAQVFVGRDTLVADAYPMKSGKQFVNTLEDNIRRQGAMDKLLSDSAKTEISNMVMDILRSYHISNWHSEPYHQNQNPADWRYRTIKSWTNTIMNRSGAPANCWLLCLIYVCYLLNHIACSALDGKIPLLCPHEMPSSKIVELILSLRVVVVTINFSRTGATSIALSNTYQMPTMMTMKMMMKMLPMTMTKTVTSFLLAETPQG